MNCLIPFYERAISSLAAAVEAELVLPAKAHGLVCTVELIPPGGEAGSVVVVVVVVVVVTVAAAVAAVVLT